MRFKETGGGLYFEPYDGTQKISFETVEGGARGGDVYTQVIALMDAGQYEYPEWSAWVGPYVDWTDWSVLRGLYKTNGDGTVTMAAYLDGEELFYFDDVEKDGSPLNTFRWGHSGGSGPAEGSFGDMWVDYLYWDTNGIFPPGTPTTDETAVETSSWGQIKSLF